MILKIDLEKAFDRIEWNFTKQALIFFNISPKLSSLIMSCISSSSISILVNKEKMTFSNPVEELGKETLSPLTSS